MLDPWLAAGQDYQLFWRLTPREVHAILDGYFAQMQQRIECDLQQSHYLAQLITFAFHDHKNMPKPPDQKQARQVVVRDIDHAQVSAYFQSMSIKGK